MALNRWQPFKTGSVLALLRSRWRWISRVSSFMLTSLDRARQNGTFMMICSVASSSLMISILCRGATSSRLSWQIRGAKISICYAISHSTRWVKRCIRKYSLRSCSIWVQRRDLWECSIAWHLKCSTWPRNPLCRMGWLASTNFLRNLSWRIWTTLWSWSKSLA